MECGCCLSDMLLLLLLLQPTGWHRLQALPAARLAQNERAESLQTNEFLHTKFATIGDRSTDQQTRKEAFQASRDLAAARTSQ